MKRKENLWEEKRKTRDAVSQITCWCIVVAVHQRYGVGRERLERIAEAMARVQDEIGAVIDELGTAKGMVALAAKLGDVCRTDFAVPLNRAVKNRRELELRRDADLAATAAWECFAVALREVLGFGTERLNAVREEAQLNYRQFNEWYREDPMWAMKRLQHCAEQAMQQEVPIIQENDPEPGYNPAEQLEYQRAAEKNLQAALVARNRQRNLQSKAVNVLSDDARREAAMQVGMMGEERGHLPQRGKALGGRKVQVEHF